MAEWKKAYEIARTNRAGKLTKFQMWLYTDAAVTLKKLPLVNSQWPYIEFNTANKYGIGMLNYRCTVTIMNTYAGVDFIALIRDTERGKLKFVINIDFDGTPLDVFIGFADIEYLEQYIHSGIDVYDIDFVSGLSSNRDLPIYDAERTNVADVVEYVDPYDFHYMNMHEALSKFATRLIGAKQNVLYAFNNIFFENWNYYIYGETYYIPEPTNIFSDLTFGLYGSLGLMNEDDRLEDLINELCNAFMGVLGYSQTYGMLCFHHYLMGRDGQNYKMVNQYTSGVTDRDELTFTLQTIDSSDIIRNEPRPKSMIYPPFASIKVSRNGFEDLPNHPIEISVNNSLIDENYLYEQLEIHLKSDFADPMYQIYTGDTPDGMPRNYPGMMHDTNFFEGSYGLNDVIFFIAGWWANLLFIKRSGLKVKVLKWLDPMFPFIYDENGTVHRMVRGRQDPINLTTEFDSIEIGPDIAFPEE